jgi:hypothetical protein
VGPAVDEAHHLAHLLLVLTILHGPERVHALLGRLEAEGRRALGRLKAQSELEGLDRQLISDTIAELEALFRDLAPVRARVANEPRGGQPVGMNGGDLKFMVRLIRAVITAMEVMARPSASGALRTKRFLSTSPIMPDALNWARKLLPAGTQGAAKLAQGPDRVVVVFGDGRIAYDPARAVAAAADDDE